MHRYLLLLHSFFYSTGTIAQPNLHDIHHITAALDSFLRHLGQPVNIPSHAIDEHFPDKLPVPLLDLFHVQIYHVSAQVPLCVTLVQNP